MLLEQELTKTQILELYLNRIYLSGGVYGVETMSRNLFGKSASAVTLPEAALIAGLIRAPSALSPWSNLEGAIERSHVVLRRMREEGFITADQERAAARVARPRFVPIRARRKHAGATRRNSCGSSSATGSAATIRPTGRCRRRSTRTCRTRRSARSTDGLRRFGDPNLQAALVAIDPATGNILAMVGGRDFRESQFNRAWRVAASAGFGVQADSLCGGAVARLLAGERARRAVDDRAAGARTSGRRATPAARTPMSLTLRAALIESNNRAATLLQQRIGSRPVLRLASDVGLRDLPDVPSLSLGHRARDAAAI